MRKLLKILLILINVAGGAALAFTALAGELNPQSHPVTVIATMTFPAWVLIAFVILLADFFFLRKWCVFMAACFAVSLPLAFTVLPVNFDRGEVPEELSRQEWTLLSYNISNYKDLTNEYPGDVNPSLTYILKTDADVVVLPEGRYLTPGAQFHIAQPQLDSIHERYPNIIIGQDITLLSKFPAREVHLNSFPRQAYLGEKGHSKAACFMVDIHNVPTAIFGVHMKSLGLTSDDKMLYKDFTRGQGITSRSEISEAKNDIISKIAAANVERAAQIDALILEIDSINCPNTIVCGDFNDTPGCYSLNMLGKAGFREVYPLVGNGYMFTYNRDRLLFQIDHVLFRGKMRPWSQIRGNLKISDHYSLLTTFIPDSERQ